MLKSILISIAVFIASLYLEASVGVNMNMPGIGAIFAAVVMGGILLYATEKKQ